ncbi:WASH complex subunit 3 [Athalia rosae]|uniref:WASH complex subunit 3 n=1 Tax=Athalia rosae TaxID=37344 RepID=UPI000626BF99|nr:WASH complex subunit 3 [Athalia rosae]
MNDYGMPIIEPTIDFTKVPPIHQKRTITLVNHFIIHTVTFLNKFALCCEERLFEFENKLQKVEASLEILESRLSSIPETHSKPETESVSNIDSKNEREDVPKADLPTVVEAPTAEVSGKEKINTRPICEDPEYAPFFKMLRVGVLAENVKLKMKENGLDPQMLDNPDHMVPIIEVTHENTATDEDDA